MRKFRTKLISSRSHQIFFLLEYFTYGVLTPSCAASATKSRSPSPTAYRTIGSLAPLTCLAGSSPNALLLPLTRTSMRECSSALIGAPNAFAISRRLRENDLPNRHHPQNSVSVATGPRTLTTTATARFPRSAAYCIRTRSPVYGTFCEYASDWDMPASSVSTTRPSAAAATEMRSVSSR